MQQQRRPGSRPPLEIHAPPAQQQQPEYDNTPQPGALGYQQQVPPPPPPGYYAPQQYVPQQAPRQYVPPPEVKKSGGSMAQIAIMGLAVLMLSIFAGTFLSPSKADLQKISDSITTVSGQAVSAGKVAGDTALKVDKFIEVAGGVNGYATKAELAAKTAPDLTPYVKGASPTNIDFSQLTAEQVIALKSKLGVTTTGTVTGIGSTVTPTGVVSYSITTPPVSSLNAYTITSGTAAYITFQIVNNTGQSRYVRPQITLSSYDSSVITSASFTVVSNTLSQAVLGPVIPIYTGYSVIWIPSTGGVNGSGEYLVDTGGTMTFTVSIVPTGVTSLWRLSFSGSDRSLTGY